MNTVNRKPFQSKDIILGKTLIRLPNYDVIGAVVATLITSYDSFGIAYGNRSTQSIMELSYVDLMELEISFNNGETWQPGYKED